MSQLNNTDFAAKYTANSGGGALFKDNTTEDITAGVIRTFASDVKESFFNLLDNAYSGAKGWSNNLNTIANLKAVVTTSLTVGVYIAFRDTGNSDVLRVYQLVSGTDAESSPTIIRPTDYASTTNEKVWKLAVIADTSIAASEVAFTPTGNIAATNTQTAIAELDTEKEIAGAAADALSDANAYTDTAIAQEVTDRDAAISTALSGLSWKNARLSTTANITLSAPQTIDGVAAIAGNRILVKNQTTQSENGLYVVAAGAWTRASDSDTNAELQNAAVLIAEGTANAGTAWVQTQSAINIGSTNIIFQQLGASVPNADGSTRGIAKLYTSTGSNTDGSMDQNSITNALAGKQASGSYLTSSNIVGTITNGVTTNAPSEDAVFDALALKAPLASPTFTGTPTLPTGTIAVTQSQGDNSTKPATTAYVDAAVSNSSSVGGDLYLYATQF